MKWYPLPKKATGSAGDQPLDGIATVPGQATTRIRPDLHPGYGCIRIFWTMGLPIG